jgi:pilus assembly protein TadC
MIFLVTLFSLYKLEPVFVPSSVLVKVTTRVKRIVVKAHVPRTIEEMKFSTKLGFVHIISFMISIIIFARSSYPPAVLVALYSIVSFFVVFFGFGARPIINIPKGKASLTLLFILRYQSLFRIANKMKMRLHPLTEKAGVFIYEIAYASKFLALLIWFIMLLPSLYLLFFSLLPFEYFIIILIVLPLIAPLIYYFPFIILRNKIGSRRVNVEKELPIFLAYASALISAGYTLYDVFKDLAVGKGKELMKTFSKEAKYFISIVEKQGIHETRALEMYATAHPSNEFKSFLFGYLHQRVLGGNIPLYLEQKLSEALDNLRRRYEEYAKNITTLTEIAITVLVLPMVVMMIGFILAPDVVINMIFLQMFVFIPFLGAVFFIAAGKIQIEFRNSYRFTYIPSVISGIISLVVAFFVAKTNIISGASIVLSGIALGYYIEYARYRRVFSEVEKILPQIFRDLSELRQMMPVPEALKRMSKMEYPKNVKKILEKASLMRDQGLLLSQQPWHSRSWAWRFTQFIIGKIEESGGGTPELFRQLMFFFTQLNNIIKSARSSLKIYEIITYAIPVIFAIVSYATLGIFTSASSMTKSLEIPPEVMQQLSSQFPQMMSLFKGISPTVLFLNDLIILEMSGILGILAGKVVSGTIRDTRAFAIALLIASIIIMFAPQLTLIIMKGI